MEKEGKRRKMISVMLPLGCCRGRGREVTGEGHALLRPIPLSNTTYNGQAPLQHVFITELLLPLYLASSLRSCNMQPASHPPTTI